MGIINTAITAGIPLGKNVLSQPHFFFFIPTTIFKANANNDNVPTAVKCDVNVNEYGNKPSKLPKATNKKTQKTKEKYFNPSAPTFSFIKPPIN